MRPRSLSAYLDSHLYSTRQANLLAHDACWCGENPERPGRNTFLYRDDDGAYFVEHRTAWDVEVDWLEPISSDEALSLYEELPVRIAPPERAFRALAAMLG